MSGPLEDRVAELERDMGVLAVDGDFDGELDPEEDTERTPVRYGDDRCGCSEGGSKQPVSAGEHGVMVTGA